MSVKIGHAAINEKGTIKNGQQGDQTGGEVCTRDWWKHDKGWTVLRCKDSKKAEKIAKCMEAMCANDNYGYSQDKRTSGINEAKKVGYDPAKVKVKCSVDCSSAVRLCCQYAGIEVGNFSTSGEKKALVNTGHFDAFDDNTTENLKRGDILVTRTKGHTVVVLSDGENYTEKVSKPVVKVTSVKAKRGAKHKDTSLTGTYETTANLHIRHGAAASYDSLVILPKGTKVKNYGFYSTDKELAKWLYIQVTYNNVKYTGFAHSNYLRKR